MTDDQANAIGRLVKNYSHDGRPVTITVGPATFDLPDGYVTFHLSTRGTDLYGGISPEGDVST